MITLTRLLFIGLLLSIPLVQAKSCPRPPAAPSAAQAKAGIKNAKDHGFLWRISKDGHDSYLYGTIHLARFEDMFIGPTVLNAVKQADTVALELDMLDPDIASRIVKSMTETKHQHISNALTTQIKQAAEDVCLPYAQISKLSPTFQMITITTAHAAYHQLYSAYAIDAFLSGFAHQMQKNVVSLESPEEQVAALTMDTPAEATLFINKALTQIHTGESEKIFLRMYQNWLNSNHADFEQYADWCDCLETAEDKKLMQRLLADRNVGMANKIDKLHQTHSTFVAVGTLHLFSDQGLPNLMRQKGYQVRQIKF